MTGSKSTNQPGESDFIIVVSGSVPKLSNRLSISQQNIMQISQQNIIQVSGFWRNKWNSPPQCLSYMQLHLVHGILELSPCSAGLLQFLAAEKKHPEEGEPLNVPVPPAPFCSPSFSIRLSAIWLASSLVFWLISLSATSSRRYYVTNQK